MSSTAEARPPVIAVCGSARIDSPSVAALAHGVGTSIGEAGLTLVCGSLEGAPGAACRGAWEARERNRSERAHLGHIVAILADSTRPSRAPYCDLVLPTGLGSASSALVVLAADSVLLIGGGARALAEVSLAWQHGKPVVALATSGGWAETLAGEAIELRRGETVRAAKDPADAIRLCLIALRSA